MGINAELIFFKSYGFPSTYILLSLIANISKDLQELSKRLF